MNPIIKPVITEKTIALASKGKFTFVVHPTADKQSIKIAVEKAFGVDVVSIVTNLIKGKTMRVGKARREKTISPFKKAVVKLTSGQKIDLFELSG